MALFDAPSAGLLSPDIESQIRNQQLLSLGLGLLQSSGPSATPTNLGQIIGQAGMGALSQGENLRDRAIQQALLGRKIAQEDSEANRIKRAREAASATVPEALRDAFANDPATAAAAAALMPQQAEPKYQVIDTTLPDGRSLKVRVDVNAADPASTMTPVGAPETKPLPAEASARKAAVDQGLALIPNIKKMLFGHDGTGNLVTNKDGIPDFKETTVADTPFFGVNPAKRELDPMILSAVEAILRAESGAAVPEEEVKRAAKRYVPNVYDTDESAWKKMQLLEDRLKRSQEAFEVGRPGARTTDTMQDGAQTTKSVNWSDL